MRKIIHIDMDAFYASVEQRDDPALRGRPVVVGGSPESRGVVCAASYEARPFGVRSAMPCSRAARLCPDAVFVPPDFSKYKKASEGLHRILVDYADAIEPLSLDEAYLDVTRDKAGLYSATLTAETIRQRVQAELNLTCSAGVAPLKFVAKIASDYNKPNGITVVRPDQITDFLRPLPIERLWGVGPATAERIRSRLMVNTVGELAALDANTVAKALGSRSLYLWKMANGVDERRVARRSGRKSRGAEQTFSEDVDDMRELIGSVRELSERACEGLNSASRPPRSVTLKVRYSDFSTITRTTTLKTPTLDPRRIADAAAALLERTDAGERAVRLVGVSLSGFEPQKVVHAGQMELPLPQRAR
ncbi:MAG: DNA polymerase-4 [Myxococcota bacterium]|jgi:DNA polymerase-4